MGGELYLFVGEGGRQGKGAERSNGGEKSRTAKLLLCYQEASVSAG